MVEYKIRYMLVLMEFRLIILRWEIEWCLECLFIILVFFNFGVDCVGGFLILILFIL